MALTAWYNTSYARITTDQFYDALNDAGVRVRCELKSAATGDRPVIHRLCYRRVPGRPVVSVGSALGTALGVVPKTADATTSTTMQRPPRHALGECLSAKEVTYVKPSSVRAEFAVDSDDEPLSGEDSEPPANGVERAASEDGGQAKQPESYKTYPFRPLGLRNPTASGSRREPRDCNSSTGITLTARLSAPLVAVGMPCASVTPTPYSTVSHSTISQRAANRTQDGAPLVGSSANRKTLTSIGLGLSPAPLTARLNAITRRDGSSNPPYSDPFAGAASVFQQRVAELAVLEADTIKYERTKRLIRIKTKVDP